MIYNQFKNMRDIKFRVWDKDGKFMVDGEYWLLMDGNGELYEYELGKLKTVTEDYEIMQFTGLLDKNGKEIYEGDIVKYRHINNVPFRKAQIRNIDNTVTLVINTVDGFIYHLTKNRNEFDLTKCEVIGNIYENTNF